MCLTLLTSQPNAFTVDLLGEYLFPRIDDQGDTRVTEVYDLFITPTEDLEEVTLTCISPHDLLGADGRLCIKTDHIPGVDGITDVAYERPLGYGCEFDATENVFTATIRDTTEHFGPLEISLSARVATPAVKLPDAANDEAVVAVMRRVGTIFQVHLDGLTAGQMSMVRLIIKPRSLLGLQEKLPLEPRWTRKPTRWKQQLSVIGPRTNRYNVESLLQKCQSLAEMCNSATCLLRLVSASGHEVVRAETHRIVVVLPQELKIVQDSCFGCVWRTEAQSFSDGRQALEWWSGTRNYWPDDSRLVAQRVWQQLSEWSKDNPKPVESMTIALDIRQENSALILDALCRAGGALYVDRAKGLYAPVELAEHEQTEMFDKVQADPQVREYFRWTGYQIEYWVEFFSAEPWIRWWHRNGPISLAFLALLGVFLGLVSIVLHFI
ncbi:MAG: hypothetical protein KAS72_00605 [Phycisphaerales bacterium]|nr:hypothetical protein [Phycisphaerales bacterium]